MKHDLRWHLVAHSVDILYKCSHCGKFFIRIVISQNIWKHIRRETISIQLLRQDFPQNINPTIYFKKILGERPYQCIHYDMTFTEKDIVKGRMRVHTGRNHLYATNVTKHFNQTIFERFTR